MTTATVNGKKVLLTMEEKARQLSVYEVPGLNGYIVSSGSEANKAYFVNSGAERCNCDARGMCSHRLAVVNYHNAKEQEREARETAASYSRIFYSEW